MKETLKRLSEIKAPTCVTVIVRTHKTHPENQQDSIILKNSITEASKRLENEFGKDVSKSYTEKLQKLADEIDHNYNDNGLMLFVNDDVAEFLRLPTRVHSRVIIDDTFATRSIVRAMKRDTDYYLLALTKGKAKLIEASSDSVVREISTNNFPVKDNDLLYNLGQLDSSDSNKMTNLISEFFNRIDKDVNKVRVGNPLPVVIYSEETNYHTYLKGADHPNTILGHVLLKNFDDSAANIVKEVWGNVMELTVAKNRARISELETALGAGTYLGDINEIWTAVQAGKGKTMFIEEGYYQAVKEENDGSLTLIAYEDINSKEHIDDIVDEMIEHCLKFGGDVVFLEKGSLNNFNKLALVTRY